MTDFLLVLKYFTHIHGINKKSGLIYGKDNKGNLIKSYLTNLKVSPLNEKQLNKSKLNKDFVQSKVCNRNDLFLQSVKDVFQVDGISYSGECYCYY